MKKKKARKTPKPVVPTRPVGRPGQGRRVAVMIRMRPEEIVILDELKIAMDSPSRSQTLRWGLAALKATLLEAQEGHGRGGFNPREI